MSKRSNRVARLRAALAPKGATPFSQPNLFAKSKRRPKQAKSTGSFRLDAPVATTSILRGNTGVPNRSMPLIRREYIGDITGSTSFSCTSYSLNPGLSGTFPWGSQIAPNFEEYETVMLKFCYEPESASSATGSVILSFDYDALDPTPTTKQNALEISDSIRAAPWVPCCLSLKSVDLKKRGPLFTRTAAVANSDLKTYDLGNLYVSTTGQAGATVIGELWIEYHFILRVPHPSGTSSSSAFTGQLITAASPSLSSVFGTTPVITGTSPVAMATVNTITFTTAGQYLVTQYITGTGTTNSIGPSTTGSTATITKIFGANLGVSSSWTDGAVEYIVTATVGQTLVLSWAAQATTVTASTTRITSYTYLLG